MDIQCEHCKTEYEFDDALVSGRGTTVRCTNCGHQFKVRKQETGDPAGDRWVVRKASGQELTFLTLRELQRAILGKQVGRSDVLRRGGAPARALATIAELEPFFEGRQSARPPPVSAPAAPTVRLNAPQPDAQPSFPKRGASWGPANEAPTSPGTPSPSAAAVARHSTDNGRSANAGAMPAPRSSQPVVADPPPRIVSTKLYDFDPTARAAAAVEEPDTLRRPPPTPASPQVSIELSSPLPPATDPRRISYGEELGEMRRHMPSSADLYNVQGRRRVGGWIVVLVLMGAVGVIGWVVAKPYLSPKPAVATVAVDPRAAAFLADGERAMAEGNLDSAQQAFDKASALAEREPRVLVGVARVAAARADVPWLKVRLLPADAKDEARTTHADLDDLVARARKAADAAVAVAPDDPAALRVRIDTLRLAGEREKARRDVSKVLAQASQPETAYVLAALDLAEPDPLWPTLVDRLRLAAAGETGAGRARAALVYALAQSGDVAGARAELAKLDAMSRPYPLSHNLHAFVDKAPSKATADGGVAEVPHVDVSSLPVTPAVAAGGGGGGGGGGTDEEARANPAESAGGMRAAQAALRAGDSNRARTIYEALLSRNPNDSEALGGLADVARAQGDLRGALAAYKRVLAINPSYLPSLIGAADAQWALGDKAGAIRAYKDISERFPEGTYPSYVKQRVEAAAAPTATEVQLPPTPAPTAAATATATTTAAPTTTATTGN